MKWRSGGGAAVEKRRGGSGRPIQERKKDRSERGKNKSARGDREGEKGVAVLAGKKKEK